MPNISNFDERPVYCNGDLLEKVQLAGLYKDSKTFVDLFQKQDEEVTLAHFKDLMRDTKGSPNKEDIHHFVLENFEEVDELLNATLIDWRPNPSNLERIKDPRYKEWASNLNHIWKDLAKRMDTDVRDHPRRHSLIWVDQPFIIPGGRFKEFYYWDSYWVIEGLLLNDMHKTTKGIISNFLSMVKTYGFIPNGGRVYYLMRSHPPLLIPMIDKYYEVTKDWDFVDKNLQLLDKEFSFWMRYKTVKVTDNNGYEHTMLRYVVNSTGPRPESYREDYELAAKAKDKRQFYNNVKAGAETGWDFSARWFIDAKGNPSLDLHNIATEDIIPVDLNSFVERNARILAKYYKQKKNLAKFRYYTTVSKQLRDAIHSVLWNEEDGIWYDYDTRHRQQRRIFYPSNLAPLYTLSYNLAKSYTYGARAVQYLKANRICDFAGGIPTSLNNSSQQWDFPNAWPPLQSIVVQGLRQTNNRDAQKFAENLASTWLNSNYIAFKKSHKMYEKYDATEAGKYGGGGEYEVQDGFGWTNGVVLEFLDTFPTLSPDHADSIQRNN
ncbi:hypothetical protein QAD02_017541, partial [Eretmocerus hayati]